MPVAIDLNSRLVAGVINQEQYETLKARCLESSKLLLLLLLLTQVVE
jgi:hypothetical protein